MILMRDSGQRLDNNISKRGDGKGERGKGGKGDMVRWEGSHQ